jgi:hypothetical protein
METKERAGVVQVLTAPRRCPWQRRDRAPTGTPETVTPQIVGIISPEPPAYRRRGDLIGAGCREAHQERFVADGAPHSAYLWRAQWDARDAFNSAHPSAACPSLNQATY